MLSNFSPPWQTVCRWFRRFVLQALLRNVHDVALILDRDRQARDQSLGAAAVGSQSIKALMAQKRQPIRRVRRAALPPTALLLFIRRGGCATETTPAGGRIIGNGRLSARHRLTNMFNFQDRLARSSSPLAVLGLRNAPCP